MVRSKSNLRIRSTGTSRMPTEQSSERLAIPLVPSYYRTIGAGMANPIGRWKDFDAPYLRMLRFTRPIERPNAKLALAMLLRCDSGTRAYLDVAGRIVAVYSGRDHSGDIAYAVGKIQSANPVNVGYTAW